MAESLIKPEVAKPAGIPPKRLILSIFGVIVGAALLLSFFYQPEAKPVTGDGVARENAAKLTDVEKENVGSALAVVAEESEKSGLPASFKPPVAAAATSGASAAQPSAPAAPGTAPNPYGPNAGGPLPGPLQSGGTAGTPGARTDGIDAGQAAREVEALNSKMVVLDAEEAPAQTRRGAAPGPAETELDRQIAEAARGAVRAGQASSGPGAAADPALTSLAVMAGDRRAQASGRGQDNAFLQEFVDQRTKAALRPSSQESRLKVLEGTIIPAVLSRDIVSDLPGVVTAQVSQDVYDSLSSRARLICKGSRVIGRYNNEVRNGQSRLLFAFTRLILPNGQSFDLAGFDGSDQGGRAGVTGDVDRHFWRIFGSSLAIGVLADRVTRATAVPQGNFASISATGQVMVDTAKQMLERNRDIAPTITIERGSLINIEVKRDMLFPQAMNASCQ